MSSSTTTTDSAGQPSSTARSRSAYWRAADSMLRSTCRKRRLAHIHDRAPPPVRLGDLAALTHRARPPRSRASSRAKRTVTSRWTLRRQRLPHRRRHHRSSPDRQRQLPRHRPPPFSPEAPPRAGRRARSPLDPLAEQPPRRRRRHDPQRRRRRRPAAADRVHARRDRPRRCRRPAGTAASSRRAQSATPAPPARRRAARPARPPAAPAPATDQQHE